MADRTSDTTADAHAQANELYWSSSESVNQLAEALDLSKGALYALIRPLPTGHACPECGAEMVFQHRTARDRGLGTCPECGAARPVEGAVFVGATGSYTREHPQPSTPRPGLSVHGTRVMVGAVLLGAAAGFIVGSRMRRS